MEFDELEMLVHSKDWSLTEKFPEFKDLKRKIVDLAME